MNIIHVENDGPRVVSSTYWGSALEAAGKTYASVNAGCVRLLIPSRADAEIEGISVGGSQPVILSRGPWPAMNCDDAVEILFEDDANCLYCKITLTADRFDLVPGEPKLGHEWTLSIWTCPDEKPKQYGPWPCKWRRVPRIPSWDRP